MSINKERSIYLDFKLGEINQGSIFCGATSETYTDVDVYGFVITARCSVANKKLSSYHYLPIVNFNDWKEYDFKQLLYDNTQRQYLEKLKNILTTSNLSKEVIGKFSYDEIQKTLESKITSKQKPKFLDTIKILKKLEHNTYSVSDLYQINTKGAEEIIKRLLSNDYVDFYIIESWDKISRNKHFFVILLREICVLKRELFYKIGNGIFRNDLNDDDYTNNDLSIHVKDEMYCVVSQTASPFVEHILQRFFYNFGRVGIEDLHYKTFENLKHLCI